MNLMLLYRVLDWCKKWDNVCHWHCRRGNVSNSHCLQLGSHFMYLCMEYILQCISIRVSGPLITGRTSTLTTALEQGVAVQAESHTQMKICKPALLCLPPARILLPTAAKSLEKSSWKFLLIYWTIFVQYPWKPQGLKNLSDEFSLKNIHDGYHFMSLLFFTLKGFVCDSPTCTCVK